MTRIARIRSLAWLFGRAAIAIALVVGYFVLYIGIGGGLTYLGFHISDIDYPNLFYRLAGQAVSCAGVLILFSVVLSWGRFKARAET